MPYSIKKKFIFFHVPKNAGCTINRVLYHACKQHIIFPKLVYDMQNNYILDGCAERFIKQVKIKNPSDFFKFAFVRNPYDKLVSGWQYAMKITKIDISFESFVKNLDKYRRYDTILWHSIISQTTHLSDKNNNLLIDWYGKVENIQKDIKIVLDKLNLSMQKIDRLNAIKHKHWTKYYTPKLKDLVYKRFQKDFENFNYDYN